MNIRLRRTFSRCMLFAMLTVTAVVQAQPPLDAPAAPHGGPVIVLSPILLTAPTAGATVQHHTHFAWGTELPALKFRVKFTIASTGEQFTVKVPLDDCGKAAGCAITVGQSGLLDHLSDGDSFTWQVIARTEDDTYKSAKNFQLADTVNAPQQLIPDDGENVLPVHHLRWESSTANKRYTVVVRDADTNQLAGKAVVMRTDCSEMCGLSSDVLDLPQGDYEWFVKAKGFNGDVAKSVTQALTITNQVVYLD